MIGQFILDYPVENLHGASYNPREIAPVLLKRLCESIERLGFAKNIIAAENGLTVAGHQRSNASRALGLKTVPTYLIKSIFKTDEIRFNQLHNGTDIDTIDKPVRVAPSTALGYAETDPADIECDFRSKGIYLRQHICELVCKFGPWGSIVATQSGEVISGHQYAVSCKQLKKACRTYRIPDDLADYARESFGQSYGEFSYAHLERRDYAQTYAQPIRLRGETQHESVLYRRFVLPFFDAEKERLLDFGCGHADHVKKLQSEGARAHGIEFFAREGKGQGSSTIDPAKVHRFIDGALEDWRDNGGFDVVVCDFVLNSVNSVQAEQDVLACVNAFAKPGARIYLSGRLSEGADSMMNITKSLGEAGRVWFRDRDGISGIWLRFGQWFFQKFHTKDQAEALCDKFIGAPVLKTNSVYWFASCVKRVELPDDVVEGALRREFDLEWPQGRRVARAEQAVAAWRASKLAAPKIGA
jgi:ParB family chromosome partitioning protein